MYSVLKYFDPSIQISMDGFYRIEGNWLFKKAKYLSESEVDDYGIKAKDRLDLINELKVHRANHESILTRLSSDEEVKKVLDKSNYEGLETYDFESKEALLKDLGETRLVKWALSGYGNTYDIWNRILESKNTK